MKVSERWDRGLVTTTLADIHAVLTEQAEDVVLQPNHYTQGSIEVIDAIEAWGLDKFGHLQNVIKYVARHEHKVNPIEDLKKAHAYLTREINKRHGIASWEKEW